jgi:hypothetical protein
VGVVERVQFFTSHTAPSEIGIRLIIRVCVTTPVGLEKEILVKPSIPGDPDIRINKLSTCDSVGLGKGLTRGTSKSETRWLVRLVVKT